MCRRARETSSDRRSWNERWLARPVSGSKRETSWARAALSSVSVCSRALARATDAMAARLSTALRSPRVNTRVERYVRKSVPSSSGDPARATEECSRRNPMSAPAPRRSATAAGIAESPARSSTIRVGDSCSTRSCQTGICARVRPRAASRKARRFGSVSVVCTESTRSPPCT